MTQPDPSPVIDLIEAFRGSKAMFAAVSLGVFDYLRGRAENAAAVAEHIGGHADSTACLLDACCALGLLTKSAGQYSNTPVADAYLTSDSALSLRGYIVYSDQALYPMWAHLGDAVRENAPRWQQAFGLHGNIFQGFFRTPAAMRDFLLGMRGFGRICCPRIVESFDLSGFRRLVDLGGATGHLAIAACQRYPNLEATVYDLPAVSALAREEVAASSVAGRVAVIEGDFFHDPLPYADLYALGRVLHDWSEEKIARLLMRIFQHLPPGGGLLVVEKLLADDGVGPVSANLQSLNMLVATEGRERSLREYTELLRSLGFGEVAGVRTGLPLDAILARKPADGHHTG